MIITMNSDKTIDGFKNIIQQTISNDNVRSIMILSADGNDFTKESIDDILKDIKIPVFGGIFPQIIYKREHFEIGNIILGLDIDANVQIIKELSNKQEHIEDELSEKFDLEDDIDTMFVFVDAFSTTISTLVDELFNTFGLEHNYIGAGAGSLSFVQKPCLYTNDGLIEDSALLISTNIMSGVGVKHGWETVEGPFQVTKSNKNIVEELNYKPAFLVYKKVVEKHSKQKFNDDNFFEIAKGYPFGISKLDNEKIVRDPIRTQNNTMICVGEVQQGNYVDILHGTKDSLVNATKNAYDTGVKNNNNILNAKITFFVDCISRVLYLEDEFDEELAVIPETSRTTIGALTLGEIANSGQDYLEFYNKTAVVGVF